MRQLLIFAKEPMLGQVKTRLACAIGDTQAVQVARMLLEITFSTAMAYKAQTKVQSQIVLVVSPNSESEFWNQYRLKDGVMIETQSSGDLGHRLWQGAAPYLEKGMPIVCLGMDCPYLNSDDIEFAFQSLEKHSVVINPATDGGYVLIGLSKSLPGLFKEMPWSSPLLFEQTVKFMNSQGVTFEIARQLSDIDEYEDLQQWNSYRIASSTAVLDA